MKLGIITHPLMNNYGGILQNYALQQVLNKMGHTVYTIDRCPKTSTKIKMLSIGKRTLLKLQGKKVRLRGWATKKEGEAINYHTRQFVKKYITTTEEITSDKDIPNLLNKYKFEGFVVGSDQVWRRSSARTNDFEFLTFLKDGAIEKKIAFSASFGVDYWEYNEKETEKYSKQAQQFDFISVREDSGVDMCERYLGVDAVHLVDPTMMLNPEDYHKLVRGFESKISPSQNLFSYVLDRSRTCNKIISTIEEKLGLSAFQVMPVQKIGQEFDKESFKLDKCVFPPVEEWITAFMKAKFVVTDSFHGTVFSILFNKPFVSIINKKRGATRFHSLLKTFGLEERAVSKPKEVTQDLLDQEIDFQNVNRIILVERQKAEQFLIESLNR